MVKVKELNEKVKQLNYDMTLLSDDESKLFEHIMYMKQHFGKPIKDSNGKLYILLDLAENVETKEDIVMYKAVFGDCKVYAESMDSFFSKVGQEYKFEFVTLT